MLFRELINMSTEEKNNLKLKYLKGTLLDRLHQKIARFKRYKLDVPKELFNKIKEAENFVSEDDLLKIEKYINELPKEIINNKIINPLYQDIYLDCSKTIHYFAIKLLILEDKIPQIIKQYYNELNSIKEEKSNNCIKKIEKLREKIVTFFDEEYKYESR